MTDEADRVARGLAEPVCVTVDSIFETLDAALNAAIEIHGNKAKAFAWDVKGYFINELGHYRVNARSQP